MNDRGQINFFVLKDTRGRLLSFDPAKNTFTVVKKYTSLHIWDIDIHDDEKLWFMGNTPKPGVRFMIVKIPERQVYKLHYLSKWRQMTIRKS